MDGARPNVPYTHIAGRIWCRWRRENSRSASAAPGSHRLVYSGVTIETYPDVCTGIYDHGHEIGHHGFRHVSPVTLSKAEELAALQQGNEAIRKITGSNARGYRSPAWDLSEHSIELLIGEGFNYDSSMMGHDFLPYYARKGDRIEHDQMNFGKPSSLVELPISWSLDDFPHFEYFRGGGLMNASSVLENWLGDFRFMQSATDWGVLTYTFHPFVIGRGHRMLMFEQLIIELSKLGATFITAEKACELFKAKEAEKA